MDEARANRCLRQDLEQGLAYGIDSGPQVTMDRLLLSGESWADIDAEEKRFRREIEGDYPTTRLIRLGDFVQGLIALWRLEVLDLEDVDYLTLNFIRQNPFCWQ